MEHDRITDLNPYFFGYVHFRSNIVDNFLINFNENASEILTTGIYVIAATQKIHNYGWYGQYVGVATIDLYEPLNKKTENCVIIDKWNQKFVWQKICRWIPISHVHVVAGIHSSHTKGTATYVYENKIR